MKKISRRKFAATALLAGIGTKSLVARGYSEINPKSKKNIPLRNKIALNAYSFNTLLRNGEMNLFDLMKFSSELGLDGVDLTGYYFPGYPAIPPDEYVYRIKRYAYELGLHICGTGVRNDFCYADPEKRNAEKKLVKDWIIVAGKLGAPGLRIFAGHNVPEGYSWNEIAEWVSEEIEACAEFGRNHGVVIEIQNHNAFLKTSDHVNNLLKLIESDWVGLKLDIGSFRTGNPYEEIASTIQHAVSWQLKENVYLDKKVTPVDLEKLIKIIAASDFKGYIPIETLGQGDPYQKVTDLFHKVKQAFG
ncbi:MAG: sugar phosphate isomerase/epimerase [Bacteroidales bacterium]|nr:sugar phosphate isomerase/epimerase [Bacteroidales bacterium]